MEQKYRAKASECRKLEEDIRKTDIDELRIQLETCYNQISTLRFHQAKLLAGEYTDRSSEQGVGIPMLRPQSLHPEPEFSDGTIDTFVFPLSLSFSLSFFFPVIHSQATVKQVTKTEDHVQPPCQEALQGFPMAVRVQNQLLHPV